ncbi:hypothetical protein DAPPUDRAFT_332910 [Daphnia pulex]|uniref:Uncharacterized protein n=1 Tax=Daphnia pulex TaxID=6669 RepID=E9HRA6_DAPPU|nr:hypothetical protein DAPPUDRAFT_332910 [Daphnia pulex]|eukprot:EFX65719.1 hypothetical protein DAPPUDRAFT_332910 [Daphnia pulex]
MQHEEEAAVHLWNFVIPSQLPKLSQSQDEKGDKKKTSIELDKEEPSEEPLETVVPWCGMLKKMLQ